MHKFVYRQLAHCALWLLLPFLALFAVSASAQHELEQHQLEEVFITGDKPTMAKDTALPIDSLDSEALRKEAANSLGQTLANMTGVTSASFGAAVGLPVIRGQSGARVSVVQNGLASLDAASVSPDHANSVDPLVAERIEIIRGPATLLYGNGAIGGVVNVIDNRIPEILPVALNGAVELRHSTASSEDSSAFKLENGVGQLAWHLDGAYRDSGDIGIPDYPIAESPIAESPIKESPANDTAIEQDQPVDEKHVHFERPETNGFIPNSDSRSHSLAAGGSWIAEQGFAGFSVSHRSNNYGLPQGSHLHDDHDEHAQDTAEDVRIDLMQTRYEFKARAERDGLFHQINGRLSYSDYEHREFVPRTEEHDEEHDPEQEEPHSDEHDDHSTRFTNRGFDSRVTAHYARDYPRLSEDWSGVLGVQLSAAEFAVVGDEGFLPRTDSRSASIFAAETIRAGQWIYEFGGRMQQVELSPELGCARDEISWSASAAAIWQTSDSINTSLSISRAQRAAGVEERYSNIDTADCSARDADALRLHTPTGWVEIGNPNLKQETSNNIEFSVHKHLGDLHGEVSIYLNRANNYIYLAASEQVPMAHYRQEDAEFYGYEAEVSLPLTISAQQQLEVTLFSDAVHAELASGHYLPRIPPRRSGVALGLMRQNWSLGLRCAYVDDARHLAPGEPNTDSYTLLEINADYHLHLGSHELLLFAKGSNLLDETIRNHTSFVKNLAPEPGRALRAGVRLSF